MFGQGQQSGAVAQLEERRFCKPEVVGSIPISSTNFEKFESLAKSGSNWNHRSLISLRLVAGVEFGSPLRLFFDN